MKSKKLLYEVAKLQKIAGLLKEDELDLFYNPLQPRKRKAKDKLIDVMVEDCIENYDGDFETWEQSLYDVMPYEITVAFRDLETAIGEKEFDDVMEYEVYPEVKKRVKNYINEEEDLDLGDNPLSFRYSQGEFQVGDDVVVSYNTSYGEQEVEFFTIVSAAKNYYQAEKKDPNIYDEWGRFMWFIRDGGESIKNQPWYEVENSRGTKQWFPEDRLELNEYS